MKKFIDRIRILLSSLRIPSSFSLRMTVLIASVFLVIGLISGSIFSKARYSELASETAVHGDTHEEGEGKCEDEGEGEGEGEEHGEDISVSSGALKMLAFTYIPVKYGLYEKATTVSGQILSEPQSTAAVSVPKGGVIKKCFAEVGMSVQAGEVLCTLTPSDGSPSIEVTAPISGVILSSFSGNNRVVDRLTVIHTIADLSEYAAVFDVYESEIGLIRPGRMIEVRSSAFKDKVFQGRITFVSPRVDEDTRTIKVRAVVKNPELLLRLGMFVSGTFMTPTTETQLMVPEAAVQEVGLERVVFVKSGSNTFKPVEIKVLETSQNVSAVKGELKPGQLVVTIGAPYLRGELLKSELAGDACSGDEK